jgi:hypothetical protein
MENIAAKAEFLRNEYLPKLRQLDANTPGKWGKMNVQQMVEHMSWSMRQANGRDIYIVVTPEDALPKWQAFLMSEKQFRENTPNQLLRDDPEPVKNVSLNNAIAELDSEIKDFFTVFDAEPGKIITNPLFGDLSYEMWVQLLHKHAWHHLRQFGINE